MPHKRLRRHHITACPWRPSSPILPNLILGTHSLVTMIVLGIGRQKRQCRPPVATAGSLSLNLLGCSSPAASRTG
jgi:hypothetical protein